MNEVMLVAQAFPPVAGSHTTRVLALARALQKDFVVRGMSLSVGTGYPQKDDNVDLNIEILRTYPGPAHFYAHGTQLQSKDTLPPSSSKSRFVLLKKMLSAFASKIYRKIEFIDSYFDWIPYLAGGIRKALKPGEIVVSTSMPNSTHVATLLSLIGKKNLWIADFGDPWTLDRSLPRSGLRSRFEKILERMIIQRADGLSFTTVATLNDYAASYPQHKTKMFLFRMGFALEDDQIQADFVEKRSVFYGGSLPAENRDASELLSVIPNFSDVEFTFAGSCIDVVKRYFSDNIPSNVHLISWLEHKEFVYNLKSKEISIIFGNVNYQQVPGKIYQMARFSNKILYVSNRDAHAIDESFEIIRGRARRSFNNRLSISIQLEALLSESPRPTLPQDYSWPTNVSSMLEFIKKVQKERH